MSRSFFARHRCVASFLLTTLLNGCISQPKPNITQGAAYPAPGVEAQQEHRDVGEPKAETAISANALDVTLTQPTECRDGTPMVRDRKEAVPVHVARDWRTCGSRPLAGSSLHLDLADGQQIEQTTDATGHARFDLSTIRWTDGALQSGKASLTTGTGQALATIDLTKLPQYASWLQARTQQQAVAAIQSNAQLDRAVVDDCFAKLDAIVSGYEAIRNPTDEQTLSTAGTFAGTLNQKCGMKDRVEADPRFQPLMQRLAPLNGRVNAITKRKCQALEVQMKAAAQELLQDTQALNKSVCYQTCIGNGYAQDTCLERCGLRFRDATPLRLADEMKKWGCK